MKQLKMKHLFIGTLLTVFFTAISLFFGGILAEANHSVYNQFYRIRGERPVDSSIVIVYLGNEDIAALGGLPLKRSYYALLVSALHEAGARAIGIDLAFPEHDREHPEQDEVFSGVVGSAHNVVMSCYFSTLNSDPERSREAKTDRFTYKLPEGMYVPQGHHPETPYPELLQSVASLGHSNLNDGLHIPLFVADGNEALPAFPLELLRIGYGAERKDLSVGDQQVSLAVTGRVISIPYSEKGEFILNYAGGTASLHMISVLRFLKEFDAWKSRNDSSATLSPYAGKLVLIGIVAEGKSLFVTTPFDDQFPSIGMHALALDTMLKGSSLTEPSFLIKGILFILCGFAATISVTLPKKKYILVYAILVICGIVVFSYGMFTKFFVALPVVEMLCAGVGVSVALIIHGQTIVQSRLITVEQEKSRVESLLLEKEHHLSKLEQKIQTMQIKESQTQNLSLLQEIKKYKEEISALQAQVEDFRIPVTDQTAMQREKNDFRGIMFSSGSPMEEVVSFIKKIAATDASVLILGESGTGKELAARAIHLESHRSTKPFIAVNCGALTETLLDSELFGHEKGAFTGAVKEKAGRFELADEGTIFLDEIAETSEAFQVKLLRVLQEGTFERVGGTITKKVNVRVIAATNRDIRREVNDKRFREDVFYRLNVFTVSLPPLRERKDDIPLLIERLMQSDGNNMKASSTVMNSLLAHEWKGNIRELQSVIKHAMVLAHAESRDLLRIRDLPAGFKPAGTEATDLEDQIVESLRSKMFARSAITETADELGGLNRGTVAEYFRGYCFKVFCEHDMNIEAAVEAIADSPDSAVREKVRKKLVEYIENAIEYVRDDESAELIITSSKSKVKNLPQRYHQYFEMLIKAKMDGKLSM